MLPSFIFLVKDQFKRAARYLCHSESSLISLAFSFVSLATLLHMLPPPQPISAASNLLGGINPFCSFCCSCLSLTSFRKRWCIHFLFSYLLIGSFSSFLDPHSGLFPTLRSFQRSLWSGSLHFFIQGIPDLCGLTVIGKLCALACSAIWVSSFI